MTPYIYSEPLVDSHPRIFPRNPSIAAENGFHTKSAWERYGRKVVKGTSADGILVRDTDLPNPFTTTLDSIQWNPETVVTEYSPVYSVNKTRQYKPQPFTKLAWRFADFFCQNRADYRFLLDGWKTATGQFLTDQDIRRHLSQKGDLAVMGGRKTNHIAIDLDLPSDGTGKPEFLNLTQLILDHCLDIQYEIGAEGCFVQIANQQAQGIHVYFWFTEPVSLNHARSRLVYSLRDLQNRHKEIVQKAVAAGLKRLAPPPFPYECEFGEWTSSYLDSFQDASSVEIFPHPTQAFRLPFAAGRTVVTDRPLKLVKGKANLKLFFQWMDTPNRTNLDSETILRFLDERIDFKPSKIRSSTSNNKKTCFLGSLKNRCWLTLTDYWLGKDQPEGVLNDILVITARLLAAEEITREETSHLLLTYCDEIPNPVSSRISDPNCRPDLIRQIDWAVRVAYGDSSYLSDSESSNQKLHTTVITWASKGLFLSDKSTWSLTYLPFNDEKVVFSHDQKVEIVSTLSPLLSSKDLNGRHRSELCLFIAEKLVSLVRRKGRISMSLFQQSLREDCGLKVGKKKKVCNIIHSLMKTNIIQRQFEGNNFIGSSMYFVPALVGEEAHLFSSVPFSENKQFSNEKMFEMQEMATAIVSDKPLF